MFEHHGVLAGGVKVEHVVFWFRALEDPIAEALFVPLIKIAVIAAKKFGREIFGLGNFVKNGVQADGTAEQGAKNLIRPNLQA